MFVSIILSFQPEVHPQIISKISMDPQIPKGIKENPIKQRNLMSYLYIIKYKRHRNTSVNLLFVHSILNVNTVLK
jgi:hypothetical protein